MPERGAAARAGRQVQQRRPQHRVLARLTALSSASLRSFTIKSGGREDGGAGAQAAVIVDHAEAGDETEPRIGDRARARASPVSWRIASIDAEMPPAAPAWPTDNCPPRVLIGKLPFALQRVGADEVGGRRPCRRSRGPRTAARRSPGNRRRSARSRWRRGRCRPARTGRRGPSAQPPRYQNGVVGEGVVPLDRAAEAARSAGPASRAPRAASRGNASAPAHGMTQSNRCIGSAISRASRYSSSVSGFLNSAMRVLQRVVALGDAELPKSSRVAP